MKHKNAICLLQHLKTKKTSCH